MVTLIQLITSTHTLDQHYSINHVMLGQQWLHCGHTVDVVAYEQERVNVTS